MVLYAALLLSVPGEHRLPAWAASATALLVVALQLGRLSPTAGLAGVRACALLPATEILRTQRPDPDLGPAVAVLVVTLAAQWWLAEEIRWRQRHEKLVRHQALIREIRILRASPAELSGARERAVAGMTGVVEPRTSAITVAPRDHCQPRKGGRLARRLLGHGRAA